MPQDNLISQSFTRFLRKVSKLKCPVCEEEFPDTEERIKSHLQQSHPDLLAASDFSTLLQRIRKGSWGAESKESALSYSQSILFVDVTNWSNVDYKENNPSRLAPPRQSLQ